MLTNVAALLEVGTSTARMIVQRDFVNIAGRSNDTKVKTKLRVLTRVALVCEDLAQAGTAKGLGNLFRQHGLAHGATQLVLQRLRALVASAKKTLFTLGHGGCTWLSFRTEDS